MMTTDNKTEELAAVFAQCLDELLSGVAVDACLSHCGTHRHEIRPLLMAVHVARSAGAVPNPSAEKARESKIEFLAASLLEGITSGTAS